MSEPTLRGNKQQFADLRGHVQSSKVLVDDDYEILRNKPTVEGVELIGDHVMSDFGDRPISNTDIQSIINRVFD